ncbi:hypothetical protein ES703_62759 [subsurface metagenome]
MRDRIVWLINIVVSLLVGSGLLYFYFSTDELIAKVLLYLVSIFLITGGINQFAFFFESLLRKIEEPRTPFSEIFFWLIPCLFLLYQFYVVDNFILRVVLIALTAIFAFVFILALGSAVADSTLGKKRINIFVALILLLLLVIGLSYAFQSTEILLFLPLLFMLSYTDYVRVKYLLKSNKSSRNIVGYKGKITISSRKIFPISLTNPLKQTYWITPLLMFLVLVIFIFYVKNLLPLPETISGLYTASLTIYTFVLSIVIAFAILVLRSRINKKLTKDIRKALFGLAQMCLVFILISLLGILLGIGIDSTIFATGTTPSDIFGSSKTVTLLQVLVFEFVLMSFPPTFMYLYAMLKGFLYQGE